MYWRDVLFYLLNKSRNIGKATVVDRARSRSYRAAYEAILKNVVPDEAVTEPEVNELPLTNHMKKKIIGLSKTTELPPDAQISAEMRLMTIPGIGMKKARELERAGASSGHDLVRIPALWNRIPLASQLFLTYQPIRKIPRKILERLEPMLRKASKTVGVKTMHIVGSYRRKMPESRDVDIMLVSSDTSVVARYVAELKKMGFGPRVYEEGHDKASMLLEYMKGKYLKVDVFRTPQSEQWAMLLYSTGSKDFNVAMRQKAVTLGFLLNQHGLYKNGKMVNTCSEQDFFKILEIPYIAPKNRTAHELYRVLKHK